MFKSKSKSNGKSTVKDTLIYGSEILSNKISDGMKYAEYQVDNINELIRKNPNLNGMKMQIEKHPVGSTLTILGVGIALYGMFRLIRK